MALWEPVEPSSRLTRDFKIYLVALVLLSLGMHVYIVLFNLYLADLGFREDWMGRLLGAMTLGTAIGTLPAAAVARRLGLRRAILISIFGLAASLAVRAVAGGAVLVAASFFSGFFLAGWFVTNAPAIAALAGRNPVAYSINNGLAIGVGAGAGLLAGLLPRWLPGESPAGSKQAALLVATGLVLLAAVVVPRMRFPAAAPPALTGPPSLLRNPQSLRFMARFLPAVALRYAFAAGLIPFFSIYLRNRHGASLETVGGLFAASQVAQALAVLLMAPLVTRLGLVRAVVAMQVLAAGCLFALWPVHGLSAAAALYLLAMSFYVMGEPALENLLMSRVPEAERPAASAGYLLLMFGTQSVVATGAGTLIATRGYETLFMALGAAGVAAAALFAALFSAAPSPPTIPASRGESAPRSSDAESSPAPRE